MRDLREEDRTRCPGFALRRLHAGELSGDEAARVRAHADGCARCAAVLAELDAADAAFRARSFDDFSRAVEARLPRVRAELVPPPKRRSPVFARAIPLALAASVAAVVFLPRLFRTPADDGVRAKGGAAVEWIVGGAGPTREAVDGERLAPGERVRLQVHPGDHGQLLALSVDAAGEVTPLYARDGRSLPVTPGTRALLPDSIAFDGAGAERLYVLFSDAPLEVAAATRAARTEFGRAGSVEGMGELPGLDAEQATTLLVKP
jgi:hypothetical protein